MKMIAPRYQIPLLIGLCALAALALIPAVHIPSPAAASRAGAAAPVPTGPVTFNDTPPTMHEVAAKHLFIAQRKATGQKSFPDLVVKGIFIGAEKSVVLSLKSRPQANLRVWEDGSDRALSQITKPDDPRQPLAAFLREWKVKEISFNGISVEHQITGEVETYAVDYTPEKKVKDDASRGYGQGIIPQGGDGGPSDGVRTAGSNTSRPGQPQQQVTAPPVTQMADRISEIVQRMTPDQRKQFLQRVQQNMTGGNQNNSAAAKQPAAKNSVSGSKNSKSKTTQGGNTTR